MEINRVLSSLGLNDVGMYLRDGPFKSDIGIVKLHPSKGTHWNCYINENYSDSYGCVPPHKLSRFIIKRNGHCLNSECQIQKKMMVLCRLLYIYNLLNKSLRNWF